MVRKVTLLCCLCLSFVGLIAQQSKFRKNNQLDQYSPISSKPSIGLDDFSKWSYATAPKISNDGNFTVYMIANQPVESNTMVIASTKNNWQRYFLNSTSYKAAFTEDSKRLIFLNQGDSLCFMNLLDSSIAYQTSVSSYKLSSSKYNEWIAFTKKNEFNELNLFNLTTNEKRLFTDVIDFKFIDNGNRLIITSQDQNKNINLVVTAFESGSDDTIYCGKEIQDLIIDNEFSQLAFVEKETDSKPFRSLWYCKLGSKETVCLINDRTKIEGRFNLKNVERFSKDGKRLFLNLIDKNAPIQNLNTAKVEVWNYTDPVLQPAQSKSFSKAFHSVLNINSKKIIQLEYEYENVQLPKSFKRKKEEYSIIIHREGSLMEYNWNIKAKPNIYLVSNLNGDRKQLSKNGEIKSPHSYTLSPSEEFVVFYDPERRNYFSFEILTETYRNITNDIKSIWSIKNDQPSSQNVPVGIVGFTEDDEDVILYDQNDIFQVSLKGNKKPINLTNGYGKVHNQIFRLAIDHSKIIFKNGEHIILSAFNRNNKKDGFYDIILGKQSDPVLRTMQPYVFVGTDEDSDVLVEKPVKAEYDNAYLVRRMNANESPNYFYTKDFKTFTQLSFVYPEKNYNWLTCELVNWKTLEGERIQGILYKPEDFNSAKKYPVIIHYYVRFSNGLNGFITPSLSYADINIPFFVSQGYVVFCIDIEYKMGYPGRSAFNTVVSAAKYLHKFSWVDAQKIGLQGHSFGGFETNYIITHTNIFRAACSSAGMGNFVSAYGSIIGGGDSRQRQYELNNGRMGCSLWECKQKYIDNSPVLNADKVSTPLLMVANKDDDDVPWQQGIEFFTALRRLGKKAWMLQYDEQGHILSGQSAPKDYTIRMKQFFDHYLKGAPAPKWMTRGIPASMKGIDDGLELDTEIKTPGPGLLIEKKTKN